MVSQTWEKNFKGLLHSDDPDMYINLKVGNATISQPFS